MICPNCGTHVADGTLRCPACHADLATTFVMPRLEQRWCASCGVQIPAGATECPNCGEPTSPLVERGAHPDIAAAEAQEADEHDDLDETFDASSTRTIARIESAVPAGPDPYGDEREEEAMPRPRVTLIASLAAIALVGGTVLFITHPWNPTAYSIRATEPADTSMAGFPGSVDALSGQDGTATATGMSGDEYSYQILLGAHSSLVELETKLLESESDLRTTGISGTQEEREAGRDAQTRLSVELSNLIARIDVVDVTSGTYAEDAQNLRTLGNWLRNWSDALTTAWAASASMDDASTHEDEILSSLYGSAGDDGTNYYQTLFNQYVEEWTPAPPPES